VTLRLRSRRAAALAAAIRSCSSLVDVVAGRPPRAHAPAPAWQPGAPTRAPLVGVVFGGDDAELASAYYTTIDVMRVPPAAGRATEAA
jgi:hypothetical protein